MARIATAARKAGQGSKWCAQDKRLAIYLRDDFCCAYCGVTVIPGVGGTATLDHVVACNIGGTNATTNLVTCCTTCNSRKQDKTIRRWYSTLRAEDHVDTKPIARRVRRNAARDIAPFRRAAKALIGLHGYSDGASLAAK